MEEILYMYSTNSYGIDVDRGGKVEQPIPLLSYILLSILRGPTIETGYRKKLFVINNLAKPNSISLTAGEEEHTPEEVFQF